MTHDPMCPQRECDACAWEGAGCCRGDCRCDEYAKVRADTLDKARNVVSREWKKPGVRSLDEMLRSLDCINDLRGES